MKKIILLFMCALLLISFTACNNNESEEETSNQQNTQKSADRQFNMESAGIDGILEEVANTLIESEEIFENSDDEEPQIMAINEQIISMMNEQIGSTLINAVNITSDDISITIYESTNAETDTELLKNFEGFNRVDMPENSERPQTNEDTQKLEDKDIEELDNEDMPESKKIKGNRGIQVNIEGSDIKNIGDYIIIANTENNEEVFTICESKLK